MANWTLKEKSTGDMTVTVDGEKWEKAQKKAFSKIAAKISIPGFRKGKAPRSILEKNISAGEKYNEAINENLNEWFREGLKELNLEPVAQAEVDIVSVDDTKAEIKFTFPVEPEAKVEGYTGLKYNLADTEVTDEDVEKDLESMRARYAENVVKDTPAENGDTVNIDYEGFKDGTPFEGGKAEGYDLVLGSGSFIPGFEDGLVGVKEGDDKDLPLTFPEDYHSADLAGAEVVFKVHVNKVQAKVLPELNDEFAEDLNMPNVSTLDELKANVRTRLENSRKNEARTNADNDLSEQFIEKVEVEIPDAMIEDEQQQLLQQQVSQMQQYGISLTQYLQMMGQTADQFKESFRETAEKQLRMRLGLKAVAKAENLIPSDEDLEKEYANIAEMYGMELDQVKSYLSADMVRADITNQKAFELIREKAEGYVKPEEPAAETAAE